MFSLKKFSIFLKESTVLPGRVLYFREAEVQYSLRKKNRKKFKSLKKIENFFKESTVLPGSTVLSLKKNRKNFQREYESTVLPGSTVLSPGSTVLSLKKSKKFSKRVLYFREVQYSL